MAEVQFENLSLAESRGVEQGLIMYYRTLNKAKYSNKINGISRFNPQCQEYMDVAMLYLPENEIYVGYCIGG